MLAEALELFKNAVEGAHGAASKVAIVDLPKDPRKYGIVDAAGKLEIRDIAPGPRCHVLGSVDQVSEFVVFATSTLGGEPTVWYSETAINVIVTDNANSQRWDRATVELRRTETFDLVSSMGGTWYPQKEFVRLLRIKLADAATDSSGGLLRVARVIGFSTSTGAHGTVEHGRESLGRDIEEQIKSEVGELPDEITLNVRIFDDPDVTRKFAIRCAVDVNPREATFNLCPLPGQLDDAFEEQMALLRSQLEDVTCPVFRGTP